MNNGAGNCKAALAIKCCRIQEGSSLRSIHAGIPSGSSAFDRMANYMRLHYYFCLCKLVLASVTSMTGSPCCTHGHKLVLGADAVSDPSPSSIAVVSTLWLPAIFYFGGKTCCAFDCNTQCK